MATGYWLDSYGKLHKMQIRDVTIVGAGPAGLAAGIAAKKAGLDYSIVEKGVLVNSIYKFPVNMVFFTTPELLEIGGLPLVSPFEKPTRLEALRYYRRVVDTYGLPIDFGEQIVDVKPASARARPNEAGEQDIFEIETRTDKGVRRIRHSRNVIFAIGYFDHPNYIGVPGEKLPHVSHYYNESHGFYRKNVVIVGGGNSAAETALELFRSGSHVTLVHRHPQLKPSIKYWVRPDIENRIKEGSVRGLLNTTVVEILPSSVVVERDGAKEEIPADAVFLLTGYHPDCDLVPARRHPAQPRDDGARVQPGYVRDERPRDFSGGRRDLRPGYLQYLHRKRAVPWRGDHQRARRTARKAYAGPADAA